MTESPTPKRSKKPRRGCLGEILALLGTAAFFGVPQLRPLAVRLFHARPGPDGQPYVTDPAAGGWVVCLGALLGSALLLAGLLLAAADWRRRRAAARAVEKEKEAEEGEAPGRPR